MLKDCFSLVPTENDFLHHLVIQQLVRDKKFSLIPVYHSCFHTVKGGVDVDGRRAELHSGGKFLCIVKS